jgi:hypothetical protein
VSERYDNCSCLRHALNSPAARSHAALQKPARGMIVGHVAHSRARSITSSLADGTSPHLFASATPASRMNFYIIDFIDIASHLRIGRGLDGPRT